MIAGVAWPDIVIAIVLAIATFKGYSRGFVSELGGAVAVTAALVTPWFYNGSFDSQIEALTHLGPGSAHVVGMFATGLATYVIVLVIARLLGTVAKLGCLVVLLGGRLGLRFRLLVNAFLLGGKQLLYAAHFLDSLLDQPAAFFESAAILLKVVLGLIEFRAPVRKFLLATPGLGIRFLATGLLFVKLLGIGL